MPFLPDNLHWNYEHGHRKASGSSKSYISWIAMKKRCNPKSYDSHPRYAARGISVCTEWESSFQKFLDDMGERPDGCTLDRVDVNDGYHKENCRWATAKQQAANKSTSVYVDFFGVKTLAIDIAREFGVPTTTLYRRIKQGYSDYDLIDRSSKNKLKSGEVVYSSKLKNDDVLKIKLLIAKGVPQKEIANSFGISQSVISNIKTGKLWNGIK